MSAFGGKIQYATLMNPGIDSVMTLSRPLPRQRIDLSPHAAFVTRLLEERGNGDQNPER
jgi:hypothetical protein